MRYLVNLNTSFNTDSQKLTLEITLLIVAVFVSPEVKNTPSTLILLDCLIMYWLAWRVILIVLFRYLGLHVIRSLVLLALRSNLFIL